MAEENKGVCSKMKLVKIKKCDDEKDILVEKLSKSWAISRIARQGSRLLRTRNIINIPRLARDFAMISTKS